ncbi:hypothetical protein [Variovorax defluvii]|uniref:hypothetical protein n=1 Tax=Variovorax defluvii TaxID=913761 RepID=UPI0031E7DC4F
MANASLSLPKKILTPLKPEIVEQLAVALPSWPALRVLKLEFMKSPLQRQRNDPISASAFKALMVAVERSSIVDFELSGYRFDDGAELAQLTSAIQSRERRNPGKGLQKLKISECWLAYPGDLASLLAFVSNNESIREIELDLMDCSKSLFSNPGQFVELRELVHSCPNLRKLTLPWQFRAFEEEKNKILGERLARDAKSEVFMILRQQYQVPKELIYEVLNQMR